MIMSNGQKVNKNYSELKVVLNRIPFADCTNNTLMPAKSKCDGSNKKTESKKSCISQVRAKRNLKQLEQADNVSTYTRSEKNKKECFSTNSVGVSAHTVPEVLKSCKVTLTRTTFDQSNQKKSTKSTTPLVKRLRKCETKNYFESSLECSTAGPSEKEFENPSTSDKKIPIYRQNSIKESKENEKDPYELNISDTDKDIPKKKQKTLNNSRKFNKTMYDLLEKLDGKEKAVKKKKLASSKLRKYDEKVNGVMKKIMSKVNDRRENMIKVNHQNTKGPRSEVLKHRQDDGFLGFENTKILAKGNSEHKNNLKVETISSKKPIKAAASNEVKETKVKPIESSNAYEDKVGFLSSNKEKHPENVQTSHQTNGNINILSVVHLRPEESPQHCIDNESDCDNDNQCTEQYFGFVDENDDIGELPVYRTIESPAFFARRPNANSTMIGGVSMSPWRLSIPGERTNHFLLYKNNSLPSLNQDMVLDHSLIEESAQHSKSRCEKVSRPKSPVQSSILDFVEGSSEHHISHNQESVRHSSLFDYEDFIVTKPRRKVLGVIQDEEINRKQTESTPRREPESSTETSRLGEILNGFDEDQENKKPRGKPFRIDSHVLRQYKRNLQAEVNEVTELPMVDETIEEPHVTSEEQTAEEVKLFEDFDSKQEMEMTIKLPTMKYERKRHRKRLLSNSCDEAKEEKPKKKKDMMTKAELDAYEKWAQEFNSMCKDVEEHQLEIE